MIESCCQHCLKEVDDEYIGRCGHKFHATCINIIFNSTKYCICPTCKTQLSENKNIEGILNKGREQDSPNYKDLVKFFNEIQSGDLIIMTKQIIEEAINLGFDLNNLDSPAKNLLYYIITNDLVYKLNMLMDFGLKLDPSEDLGNYVWETALKNNSLCILDRMKNFGFDPKSVEISSTTPIRVAMWTIKNGLEIDKKVKNLDLIYKSCELLGISIIKTAIILNNLDVNRKDENGRSHLHIYISSTENNNLQFIQELIDLGAEIDSIDCNNETPLYVALKREKMTIVNFLLSKGANLDTPKIKELGSIMFFVLNICHKYEFSLFQQFLQYIPPNINEIDQNGQTCLHKVMLSNYSLNYVKLFVELGADVNAQDFQGNTPLHIYSFQSNCDKSKLEYLLEIGADIYLDNNEGNNFLVLSLIRNQIYY